MNLVKFGINKFELYWNKFFYLNDFSKIYQEGDFNKDVDYYGIDDENEIIKKEKGKAAVKKLKDVKLRLDLLGYTLKNIKNMYYDYINESIVREEMPNYDVFYDALINLDISKITFPRDIIEYSEDFDDGEYFRDIIFSDKNVHKQFNKIFNTTDINVFSYIEWIDPFIVLRILAENENNLNYDVVWRYEDDFYEENYFKPIMLENKDKILIVTEGKTDTNIIKKAIKLIYPPIDDFFQYIDMNENYPFTGSGSLKSFTKGLIKINSLNNIIVIFDNDTEGIKEYNEAIKINNRPNNILIYHLPNNDLFNKMDTIGPSGENIDNINGRAVSIECFLDLNNNNSNPKIRWTNYDEKAEEYQGALINKEQYTKNFLKLKLEDLAQYDLSKLKFLIDDIIDKWINRK